MRFRWWTYARQRVYLGDPDSGAEPFILIAKVRPRWYWWALRLYEVAWLIVHRLHPISAWEVSRIVYASALTAKDIRRGPAPWDHADAAKE